VVHNAAQSCSDNVPSYPPDSHRRAGFCWWGPEANIEDGSSLIIHWSRGSRKRSTNWANQYDIYFGGAPTGRGPGAMVPLDPLNLALSHRSSDNSLLEVTARGVQSNKDYIYIILGLLQPV